MLKQIVHISRLKKYYQPSRPIEWINIENEFNWQKELETEREERMKEQEERQKAKEDQEFEVTKIIDSRKKKGQSIEYKGTH